jgi:hypothetical protein
MIETSTLMAVRRNLEYSSYSYYKLIVKRSQLEIGDIIVMDDGEYYYFPLHGRSGGFSSNNLKEITNILDQLNADNTYPDPNMDMQTQS